jgi:hypothetical protein
MEQYWFDNVYDILKRYSDIEEQKEVWLWLNPNKVSSYDEDLCMLFDDNDFEEFILEWKKEGLDKKTLREMIVFRDVLNFYNKNIHQQGWHDEKVLKDPEWQKIVNQAKKVIEVWSIIPT